MDILCKKALLEIRDLLRDINCQMTHLLEQNRMEKILFSRSGEEKDFVDDEDE